MPVSHSLRFLLLPLLGLLAFAFQASALEVQSVALRPAPGGEQVAITLDLPVSPRLLELADPPRIVLDFPALDWRASPGGVTGGIVRGIRHARFDADTTRLVIDLARPAPRPRIELVQEGGRYTLLATFDGAPSPTVSGGSPPVPPPTVEVGIPPAVSGFPVPRDKPSPALQKPLIAIDAGHGGRDPGAIGPGGTQEKIVTLAFARALRDALEATGRYRAMLVREGDRIVALRERPAIARKQGADLFLSLHADALPNGAMARGLSIYTLSTDASDAEAAQLAASENKADIIAGIDLSGADPDVAGILIDLAQRDTNQRSEQLAESVVSGMREAGVPLHKHPRRAAGFAVLKAPDTPSALVELGFISTPEEERALQQKGHRDRIARGLVTGIDRFFRQYHR